MGGNLLVSCHLAEYCLKKDIPTSDYGQAEFNSPDNLRIYHESRIWEMFFPIAPQILEHNIEYNEHQVVENIEQQKYTCIALTTASYYWLDTSIIERAGYKKLAVLDLRTGEQKEIWKTTFYVLQNNHPFDRGSYE